MFQAPLFSLSVCGVFTAEPAVFVHLHPVRRVLLVLHGVVISLFALVAPKGNFHAHVFGTSYSRPPCEFGSFGSITRTTKKTSLPTGEGSIAYPTVLGQLFFALITVTTEKFTIPRHLIVYIAHFFLKKFHLLFYFSFSNF